MADHDSTAAAPDPVRFALTIHYDGAPFHGWQLQPGVPTVQGTIEEVLARIAGGERIPVTASGRTDSGVHATGQIAAIDLPPRWTARELRRSLNALVPDSIWIEEVRRVPSTFHPRFDARRRSYLYRLGTSPDARSPHLRRICWPSDHAPPDPDLLRAAAALIPGERSFRAFARSGQEERGDRCEVHDARWSPWEEIGWSFRITANRYLHHMVRYLVGTMVEVARGGRPFEEMETLLNDPDPPFVTSPPAPPEGLFLARVEYDADSMGDDPDRDPNPDPDGAIPSPIRIPSTNPTSTTETDDA